MQPTKPWNTVYTRPHHEKDVFRRLRKQVIPGYTPIYTSIRNGSDGKRKAGIPKYRCYEFL